MATLRELMCSTAETLTKNVAPVLHQSQRQGCVAKTQPEKFTQRHARSMAC